MDTIKKSGALDSRFYEQSTRAFKESFYKKGKCYYPYVHFDLALGISQISYIWDERTKKYQGHEAWPEYGKYKTFSLKTF